MKYLWLALALLNTGAAQVITPSGAASARPGAAVAVTVALSGATATGPTALQFDAVAPALWTLSEPSTAVAGRTAACGFPATVVCVLYGNMDVIPNGAVFGFKVTVPLGATPGDYPIALARPIAASQSGNPHPLTVGSPHMVRVLHLADVNGDGSLTVADVGLIADQAMNKSACVSDQNADGACNIVDVYIVVRAVLLGG